MSESSNIYQRINEIRKAVKYVKKDLQVMEYTAVSHDAVTSAVRKACIDNGVLVFPSVKESKTVPIEGARTAKGVQLYRYEAVIQVGFINIDAPDDRIVTMVDAHGLDSHDKSPGKALSMATKYALLKMFMLETGENEESREDMVPATLGDVHIKNLMAMCEDAGVEPESTLMRLAVKVFHVKSVDKIPLYRYEEAVTKLGEKLADHEAKNA